MGTNRGPGEQRDRYCSRDWDEKSAERAEDTAVEANDFATGTTGGMGARVANRGVPSGSGADDGPAVGNKDRLEAHASLKMASIFAVSRSESTRRRLRLCSAGVTAMDGTNEAVETTGAAAEKETAHAAVDVVVVTTPA